jgi:hypothetical protein
VSEHSGISDVHDPGDPKPDRKWLLEEMSQLLLTPISHGVDLSGADKSWTDRVTKVQDLYLDVLRDETYNLRAVDPKLAALIPEPFTTVKPGDQVTLYIEKQPEDYPTSQLPKFLERFAPEVSWLIVEGVGITGVIHVAREDRTPQP